MDYFVANMHKESQWHLTFVDIKPWPTSGILNIWACVFFWVQWQRGRFLCNNNLNFVLFTLNYCMASENYNAQVEWTIVTLSLKVQPPKLVECVITLMFPSESVFIAELFSFWYLKAFMEHKVGVCSGPWWHECQSYKHIHFSINPVHL